MLEAEQLQLGHAHAGSAAQKQRERPTFRCVYFTIMIITLAIIRFNSPCNHDNAFVGPVCRHGLDSNADMFCTIQFAAFVDDVMRL